MQNSSENIDAAPKRILISLFTASLDSKNNLQEPKLIEDLPMKWQTEGLFSDENESKHKSLQILTSINKDPEDFLPGIPDEIALEILKYLAKNDLKSTLLVNKKWSALTKDITLWKRFFHQYTKGFLWQYLFKTPHVDAYKTYFLEVFSIADPLYEKFEDFFTKAVKEKFIYEHNALDQIRLTVRKNYFKDLEAKVIKAQLTNIIELIKKIPETIRQNYLTAFQTKTDLRYEDYQKVLPILFQIAELDTLLTDLIYMGKFCNLTKVYMSWFFNKENVMLSARAIVALCVYSKSNILQMVFENPVLYHLRNKFGRTELLECQNLDKLAIITVLKNPTSINLLSDDDLIVFMKELDSFKLNSDFYSLIEESPNLVSRLDSRLLVKLTQINFYFTLLILTNPKLLPKLTDEAIVNISKNCMASVFEEILNSKTFFEFLVKKDPSYWLKLEQLPILLKNDQIAEKLDPAKTLNIAQYELSKVGIAIAKQNIILKKLNPEQKLALALRHPDIAIELFKNETLYSLWRSSDLDKIKSEYKNTQWNDEISLHVRQREEYLYQLIKTDSSRPQQVIAFTHISVDPVENIPPKSRKEKRGFRNDNQRKKSSSVKKIQTQFSYWKILGGICLILLAIGGLVLTATGLGGILGLPLTLTILTTINLLNISVQALAIASLVIGAITTICSITAILANCGQQIKNCFKSFKTSLPNQELLVKHLPDDTYSNLMNKSLQKGNIFGEEPNVASENPTNSYDTISFTKKKIVPSNAIKSTSIAEDLVTTKPRSWRSKSF